MKNKRYAVIAFFSSFLFFTSMNAEEYILEIELDSTTTGNEFAFKYEKINIKSTIFKKKGKWFGRNPGNGNTWELTILKEDQFILILDNPVFFSGKSIIYIMKPTGHFYWSEFAYSNILNEQEATIRYGKFTKKN